MDKSEIAVDANAEAIWLWAMKNYGSRALPELQVDALQSTLEATTRAYKQYRLGWPHIRVLRRHGALGVPPRGGHDATLWRQGIAAIAPDLPPIEAIQGNAEPLFHERLIMSGGAIVTIAATDGGVLVATGPAWATAPARYTPADLRRQIDAMTRCAEALEAV